MTTRVTFNTAALRALSESGVFDPVLERLGEDISQDAAANAPRSATEPVNGHMADSIHYEMGHDGKGAFVRISWDKDHWYGIFAEVGTSKESARPFLRPAAEKHRPL